MGENWKKSFANVSLTPEDVRWIEKDELVKFEKESYDAIQKRLDAYLEEIENAQRAILELENRVSVLRQMIGQGKGSADTTWFSICPMCETIHVSKVKICTNCGFTDGQ